MDANLRQQELERVGHIISAAENQCEEQGEWERERGREGGTEKKERECLALITLFFYSAGSSAGLVPPCFPTLNKAIQIMIVPSVDPLGDPSPRQS